MSFFKNIFGQNDTGATKPTLVPWENLTTLAQLDAVIELSNTVTCVIFKHSTRCIVSRTALKQFEHEFDANENLKLFFLDLLAHRDISNAIAERLFIQHESPQIIVLKKEKVVYSASHSAIDATILERFV
ncbi:bacillithiol system redox-active protein YtxJ [Flavobacterium agricola]|uniref:Bacillithiol system redox-active protein YtxJ n=1 Tax=Flavobacterium agricola TaxID=2870839 RepID=A0ABY6M3I8_9FLAO|nr:bacillithiol system redox-active protein YtxJ [Flavobacterium agricola]UYW02319.1 bacillithiol system redox-active protein YtxJ [Flavobacterium agricola]